MSLGIISDNHPHHKQRGIIGRLLTKLKKEGTLIIIFCNILHVNSV